MKQLRNIFFLLGVLGITQCKKEMRQEISDTDAVQNNSKAIYLLGKYGCLGCHSEDGSRLVGPTFKGLYGRTTKLGNGKSLTVDEAYLKRSIQEPNADVVDGYPAGLMPKRVIHEQEIDLMIQYLKGL